MLKPQGSGVAQSRRHLRPSTPTRCDRQELGPRPREAAPRPVRSRLDRQEQGGVGQPNLLPASVRDRLNTTWEPLFLLTRQRDYFFDLDAIRIPPGRPLAGPRRRGPPPSTGSEAGDGPSGQAAGRQQLGPGKMKARGLRHPLGRTRRCLDHPDRGLPRAHFATFPRALVERPLKATCPERVCRTCGGAWHRAPVNDRSARLRCSPTPQVLRLLRSVLAAGHRRSTRSSVLARFGVVAERLNRRWFGIELNAAYASGRSPRPRAAGSAMSRGLVGGQRPGTQTPNRGCRSASIGGVVPCPTRTPHPEERKVKTLAIRLDPETSRPVGVIAQLSGSTITDEIPHRHLTPRGEQGDQRRPRRAAAELLGDRA